MIETIRNQVGAAVRTTLGGSSEPPDPADFIDPDGGLFGPDSATWIVHTDIAGLVGGLRALLYQTLHPLAMAGVADHSTYKSDPLGRLQRTGAFIGTTTFASVDDAERMIESVRRIHTRVTGTAPDGRPYHATDPHLLSWVHCTEVDSFLRAHQRYGIRRLSEAEADRYVAEMAEIGERLGAESPPTDVDGLAARLWAFRPELDVGRQARDTVRFLVWPPGLPLQTRPAYGILLAAAVGLLPGDARRMLRLPVAPLAEPLAIRPATTMLVRTLGWALGPHPALAST